MIKVGFIGTGGMGRYQAKHFAMIRSCRVAAGCDVSARSRRAFTEDHPDAKLYNDHRQLLRDPDIDAVVIASPTGLHSALTIDALKARKPTMVEKPMARTVAQCRRMNEASRRYKTLLMVAHCRRYDRDWGTIAKVIKGGHLGRPVFWRVSGCGSGPGGWFMDDKMGGGPLIDAMVHNYDFANLMFGDPDSIISSSIKMNRRVTAVDTGAAVVRYKSGDQCMMCMSWAVPGMGLFDTMGPKGFLRSGPCDITPPKSEKGKFGYHCLTDLKRKSRLFKFPLHKGGMVLEQAKHFLACINGKTKCKTPGTEAIKAVAIAEAVLKSAPKGQAMKVRW